MSGELKQATILLEHFELKYSPTTDFHILRAALAESKGQYRLSLESAKSADALSPHNAQVLSHLARMQVLLREHSDAVETARRALATTKLTGTQHAALGSVFTQCAQHDLAVDSFREALKEAPDNPTNYFNLGSALRFLGDFEGASNCFEEAIAKRPDDCEAYYALCGLRRQTNSSNHIHELTSLLERGNLEVRAEVLVCYSLAKELEDLEEWQQSFAYLNRGASLKRRHTRYDVQNDVKKMSMLSSRFDALAMRWGNRGHDSQEPIFVVGLPRVGSTVVERILCSHSRVSSAGELDNFSVEWLRPIHAEHGTTNLPPDRLITEALRLDNYALGARYLSSTRYLTGECDHFVDKMPLNFLNIGLIARAFPRARIIHVRRNPMDACFAMFKTLFKSAYPFSYDLSDLGHYYLAYDRLMKHWESLLGGRLTTVDYESLIANQRKATQEILDNCGLAWEPGCLEFHTLDTPSTTASAVQVRKPLYASSLDRWRRYEQELSPLHDFFTQNGLLGEEKAPL